MIRIRVNHVTAKDAPKNPIRNVLVGTEGEMYRVIREALKGKKAPSQFIFTVEICKRGEVVELVATEEIS